MKARKLMWTAVSVSLVVLALIVPGALPVARAAGNPNPRVLPPQSRPYGMTYAEWTARWVQWIFSIPADQSPLTDPDGRFCHVGQSGPVFFLGSNFGGTSVRSCTVPAGKSFLFTPGGTIAFNTPGAETQDQLRAELAMGLADLTNVAAEVDGVPIHQLESYLVPSSPFFTFPLPPDNVFEIPAGPYDAFAGGFFLLLAPLPVGPHVIHMHDEFANGTVVSDVTYNLTIAPRGGN